MADTDKYSKQTPAEREAQKQRGEANLQRKAQKEAETSGKPVEDEVRKLRQQTEQRSYRVAQLMVVALVVVLIAVIGLAVWQSQQVKTKADQAANTPTPTATVQLSKQIIRQLLRDSRAGATHRELAVRHGISVSSVKRLLRSQRMHSWLIYPLEARRAAARPERSD